MLPRVTLPRALTVLLVAGLLAGCTATPAPEPSDTEAARAQECADAAADIVTAAEELVAEYELPDPAASPDPEASAPTGEPEPAPTATSDAIADAIAAARETRNRLGCDPEQFAAKLRTDLDEIEPDGAIAQAVWRRVSASVLGTVEQEPREWVMSPDENLPDVLARAAEGTTVVLPAGTIEVDDTLVLLAGVTLRGAGRDATVLRSSAPDAAILVVTASVVRLEGLSLSLAAGVPTSGIVGGPSTSLALTGVRVTGATTEGEGAGGAGVYLSAHASEGAGRGTTLEVTDSMFDANAWAGLAVAGGHRISVESSTFAGNGGAGIVLLDATTGSIGSSTFTDNPVGLAAAGTSAPTILGSTFTGGTIGVQADASAAPVLDGLTISGAGSAAVIFGGTSGGSVNGTTCRDVANGIVIADTAAPTLGSNECTIARGAG